MIKGIGIDIIEIARIAQAIERHGSSFVNRLFTEREQATNTPTHFAGRFAAKEAVVKALGTGFRGISWKDIEIVNDTLGKPIVILAKHIQERFDYPELLITISHSKETACAFCLWQSA